MAAPFGGLSISHVVGVESRGFSRGAPIALELGAGFIPVRKPGKLPHRTAAAEYALEYGTDRLEIHADACAPETRVLVVDDVLATGGAPAATSPPRGPTGGVRVGSALMMELSVPPRPGVRPR